MGLCGCVCVCDVQVFRFALSFPLFLRRLRVVCVLRCNVCHFPILYIDGGRSPEPNPFGICQILLLQWSSSRTSTLQPLIPCVCVISSASTPKHDRTIKTKSKTTEDKKKPIWRGTIKRDQDEIIFTILWLLSACFQLIQACKQLNIFIHTLHFAMAPLFFSAHCEQHKHISVWFYIFSLLSFESVAAHSLRNQRKY